MTRFKELKRIENAINQKDKTDLDWALGYAKMRVQIAPNKVHQKHWQKIQREIQTALKDQGDRN